MARTRTAVTVQLALLAVVVLIGFGVAGISCVKMSHENAPCLCAPAHVTAVSVPGVIGGSLLPPPPIVFVAALVLMSLSPIVLRVRATAHGRASPAALQRFLF